MPKIFDNIEQSLLPALQDSLKVSERADFCIGYFNLRGWRKIDKHIEHWSGGNEQCCRLLIGMSNRPQEILHSELSILEKMNDSILDNQKALRLKKEIAQDFRDQLTIGVPNNKDEEGLRRLAKQIKTKKVIVKLFLSHPLHAKLYLLFRSDKILSKIGYLGSSNLTLAGLLNQGELNVDVMDDDACSKLARWFEDRWNDRWCVDISKELVEIIEESWAREEIIPPHHIYIKIAYHLSQEARAGLTEFKIPKDFGDKLLSFQAAAVQIAAQHLNKRNGVIIGDVVGLGKTLMATALARVFEDDYGLETLIICPPNLVTMWEDYKDQYRLRAKIISLGSVINQLPELRRYRIVVIDESHNLRNREGKRYRIIQEYIQKNDSKCILLSATPYNKTYHDLSNQLRLFLPEDQDLGIRPEQLLKESGETEFIRRHQASVKSLAAFEKSDHADDWRELMRLYLVRRTRSFIRENYSEIDKAGRSYLRFNDGSKSYFPNRIPKTVKFKMDSNDSGDQYAKLLSVEVITTINGLMLPRYGLGNYIVENPDAPPAPKAADIIKDLSRAGKRLMGFCRTNLLKRMESGGSAFLLSLERHILRNYIFLHALENNLELPIGITGASLLDKFLSDSDSETDIPEDDQNEQFHLDQGENQQRLMDEKGFQRQAMQIYKTYETLEKRHFRWLGASHFQERLVEDLKADSKALIKCLNSFGNWDPKKDQKLNKLIELLQQKHPSEKVLIFSQFADTIKYLNKHLKKNGIQALAAASGDTENPTSRAWHFSPRSNKKDIKPEDELRVLLSTDVLSEGQNLQDAHIVVNYDLPWAIIRLIQRAGRVDRIGQTSDKILCYSFLPAEGIEKIIKLRARVRQRLTENAEVVGTDEAFFEDEDEQVVHDLYNEKSGIFDGEDDNEVDLSSYAYQIWKNAVENDSSLKKKIEEMPNVVYSTKQHVPRPDGPEGVLIYSRTPNDNDALSWVDKDGNNVTESQFEILKAAECPPETPGLERSAQHHELVEKGVEYITKEEKKVGGSLGRPSGARFRAYDRLKEYLNTISSTLLETSALKKAIEEIYRYPLRPVAIDTLNRQLKSGIQDDQLANLVVRMREEDKLCIMEDHDQPQEPQVICSMGLREKK